MPIYEYVCKKCHFEFETLIRGEERPECPNCGDKKLERLLSVPAAHTSSSPSTPPCGEACGLGRDGGGPCGFGGCGEGFCGLG
ncbi:MAG: zinc ribbon domain-containing protein [Pirellulaceae bacterium]|jgi:putative FmdB family regulatory protein|nr:zinc ribbon domain-containing protein [Pirellulaceae bacterium]